jgi:NADPH-dependent 7-cyano-7-deazaguanine reductase QueF
LFFNKTIIITSKELNNSLTKYRMKRKTHEERTQDVAAILRNVMSGTVLAQALREAKISKGTYLKLESKKSQKLKPEHLSSTTAKAILTKSL